MVDPSAEEVAAAARKLDGRATRPTPRDARAVLRYLWGADPLAEAGVSRDELVRFARRWPRATSGREEQLRKRLVGMERDLPRPMALSSLALLLAAIADRQR